MSWGTIWLDGNVVIGGNVVSLNIDQLSVIRFCYWFDSFTDAKRIHFN